MITTTSTFKGAYEESQEKTKIEDIQDLEFNQPMPTGETGEGDIPLKDKEYGNYHLPVISDAEVQKIKGK